MVAEPDARPTSVTGDASASVALPPAAPTTGRGPGLGVAWAAVAFLLIAVAAIAAVLAWLAPDLRREWLVGAALGTLLLAVAGVFDAVLLARSRRPLDMAHGALRVAADDLTASYDALELAYQALGETAEARDQALVSLRAAVREREAFLASVSHDLNTPLTVIRGHAQVLKGRAQRDGGLNAEQVARAMTSIDASALQLKAMIDGLLELAHQEMGEAPFLAPRPIDLVALAREVVETHGRSTDRHRLRFVAAVPATVGEWDEPSLERVLGNLLTNAVKYSPVGGEVRVTVAQDGDHATLTVADDGIGIPAAELPRVFDRFYRASNATETIDGSGLGLAGVRQLVAAHGGTIAVESEPGAGSTFTVRLPLRPDFGPAAPAPIEPAGSAAT